MAGSVVQSPRERHYLLPDNAPRMAKATVRHVRKPDVDDLKAVAAAVLKACDTVGWSLKELACALGKDERQVARWLDGSQRPHFDALFSVEPLRQPLVIALAALAGDEVEIQTVITVRRKRA